MGQEDTGLWEGGLQGEGKKGRLEKMDYFEKVEGKTGSKNVG